MEGYRIFTVSSERFPAFAGFIAGLKKKGIKVITIVDPGTKVDPAYSIYQEEIKGGYVATFNGEPYVNAVWPGDSVYPAFNEPKVQAWWADKIATFVKTYGISGIWCDMLVYTYNGKSNSHTTYSWDQVTPSYIDTAKFTKITDAAAVLALGVSASALC